MEHLEGGLVNLGKPDLGGGRCIHAYIFVCTYICMRERERERKREYMYICTADFWKLGLMSAFHLVPGS